MEGAPQVTEKARFSDDPDLAIPMRDGITLSARVWLPDQPAPAILEALPYRKRDGTAARDATTHVRFASMGYACVRLDLRGAGESGGVFDDEYSEQELQDIEDAIAWIAAQGWCSGAVGMMGISWGGFNGLQVAARQPPALKAVISLASSVDRYADDIHYKGGCQLTENIGWAATAMSWLTQPPDPALREDWREIWRDRLDAAPFLASTWLRHPTRDAYWKHGSICEDYNDLQIPVLAIAGLHDGYRNTPFHLATHRPAQTAALIGPWNHKYPHLAKPGPQLDFVTEAVAWWDRHLKGEPGDPFPPVRVYLMDGIPPETRYDHRPGRWLALPEWPAPDAEIETLFVTNKGLSAQTGPLDRSVGTDPRHGETCGEFFPFGFGPGELPGDQQPDDARATIFDAEPLTAPLVILGAPEVELTLGSSETFGQIVLRLCDVAPNGASHLITFGLLNLQFRDGFEEARPLEPGADVTIRLALDHAAYELPEGHRLRLSVAPSYWPFAWPERGPVTLRLTGGSIALPTLPDPGRWAAETGTPVVETPPSHRVLRAPEESKRWFDADGLRHLEIVGDHGETEDLSHGLRIASAVREMWSMDPGDVATARAEIIWTRSLTRDAIVARSALRTEMWSDPTHLHVEMTLEAHDGDKRVFTKTYRDSMPRKIDGS